MHRGAILWLVFCALSAACGRVGYEQVDPESGLPIDEDAGTDSDAEVDGGMSIGVDGSTPGGPSHARIDYRRSWLRLLVNRAMDPLAPTTEGFTSPVFTATGLPAGLAIDPETGVITGTPTARGTTAASIRARDANGERRADLEITILDGFVVNTYDDLPASGDVLDGICETFAANCSLRAAIEEARGGTYVIVLPDGYYTLNSALDILGEITIAGSRFAESMLLGTGTTHMLDIGPTSTVHLSDVKFRDGYSAESGGCILSEGALRMAACEMNRCSAGLGGGCIALPGLIAGDLRIESSFLHECDSGSDGGAILALGSVSMSIEASFFEDNTTNAGGGAIFANADLEVARSTFVHNTTGVRGGAIHMSSAVVGSIVNSTFIRNEATRGGAISSDGTCEVRFDTFADNVAAFEGSAFYILEGAMTLEANAMARHVRGATDYTCAVIGGTAVSEGFNFTDATSCDAVFTDPSDRRGIDVGLASDLQASELPSLPAIAGSPLIDAIDGCAQAIDLRGFERPFDADLDGTSRCDVGAREEP